MAITLEHSVRIGEQELAAIVECTVVALGRDAPYGWGLKRPLAILVARGREIRAFDLRGNAAALDDIEHLCPGAIAAMRRRR